jgi:hypothetical protein
MVEAFIGLLRNTEETTSEDVKVKIDEVFM